MFIFPAHTPQKLGYDVILEATSVYLRSEMGHEELDKLAPVSDTARIHHMLELLTETRKLLQSGDPIPFDHPYDIRESAARARVKRAVLDTERLYQIARFCATCRTLRSFIRARNESCPKLAGFLSRLEPVQELEKKILSVITEHGAVRDDASPALKQIRKNLSSRKNDLRAALDRIIRKLTKDGYLAEFEATIRNGRMVLPVKAEHKRKINGFVQDVSATGQTVYLEPSEALHINNDIRELERGESQEVEKLLMELTASAGSFYDQLTGNALVLGQFDLLTAKASLSEKLDCSVPTIEPEGPASYVEARNPVLILKQLKLKKDDREPVVPLTLEMETHESGIIITGPNAGGKSVSLKTVALMQMMLQSGFAVPLLDHSVMPVFDSLFLDMGDEQSIDNDLSTFSSRLSWMKTTAEKAGSKSLVLVDEAGTGTDPDEGVALFQAFLERMAESGAFVIATTHHGNLKVFAHNHKSFVNASMEFDSKRLTPTYHFQKGLPGSSYAFEIGSRLGLPQSILKRARELTGDTKNRLESLILEMEDKTQRASKLEKEADQEKQKTERLISEYRKRLSTLTTERDKLREKALQDAREIMQSANARIEEAIQRVYEAGSDKKKIKAIRAEVDAHKSDVDRELQSVSRKRKSPKSKNSTPPEVGDTVRFLDTSSTGELLEINGKQALVQVNGLRLKTKYNNLEKTEKTAPPKKGITLTEAPHSSTGTVVRPKLDLRGFRGEEASKELMHYLDRIASSHLRKVEIIHGKGDGILKKIVHEQLESRKEVASFELAPWDQGGPGCTVVEMK